MGALLVGCKSEAPTIKEDSKEEIEVILNSVENTKEDKWDELGEGKELLLLNVTIKNNSNKEYEFMPDYFSLEIDGNKVHVTDIAPKEGNVLHTTTIAPGDSIEGLINFTIDEAAEYKIIYDDFNIKIEL